MTFETFVRFGKLPFRVQRNSRNNPIACIENLLGLQGIASDKESIGNMFTEFKTKITYEALSSILSHWFERVMVVQIPFEKLDTVPFPCMVVMNFNKVKEFVVLVGTSETHVFFLNPRLGWLAQDKQEFVSQWTNILVLLKTRIDQEKLLTAGWPITIERTTNRTVKIIPDFLDDASCRSIIELSDKRFEESKVFTKTKTTTIQKNHRNSYSAVLPLDHPLTLTLCRKIESTLGFDYGRLEPFQCVRYSENQFFHYHYDSFNNKTETGKDQIQQHGHRSHTLLVYLNEDFAGGWTAFPLLNVLVQPAKGTCVLFENINKERNLVRESYHAGLPVLSGTKYALNIWVREFNYSIFKK